MALQKEKTMSCGVTGDYWKIVEERYDRCTHRCEWVIALYTSQAVSLAKGAPLPLRKTFSKVLTSEQASGNRTAVGYVHIMTKSAEMVAPPFGFIPDLETPFDPDLAGAVSI